MTPTQTFDVTKVLERTRAQMEPTLRDAIGDLPGSLRLMAAYHLGWCDANGMPSVGYGGKAIRPAMALLACGAVGARAEAAVPAAVAVELVHNYSLVHDDVMDGDVTRRHRATVWSVYGVPSAILVGDAMLTQALRILSADSRMGPAAVAVATAAIQELHEGQASDLAFERQTEVSLPECRTMAAGKTAAMLGCAAELGAMAGRGTRAQAAALRRFAEQVGMAFQLVDDLLGIWGDPAATGKPADTDLRTGKMSLPVVAALNSGTGAGAELKRCYRAQSSDVAGMAELVEQAGGRAWAADEIDRSLSTAEASLREADLAPAFVGELLALATFLAQRTN